jgi:hypothetical protein
MTLASGPFGPGLFRRFGENSRWYFRRISAPVEVQEGGRFECDGDSSQAFRFNEKRKETGDDAVPELEVRCAATGSVQHQELVLQQHRFRNHGSGTAGPDEPRNGDKDMQEESKEIAH